MAQRTERISCPRCGANNFDTVTACWKCGTALGSGAAAGISASLPPTVPAASYSVERAITPAQNPYGSAGAAAGHPNTYMNAAPALPAASGDTGLAKRAAFWLGVTIPWIGLPIGWVFMMIEDSRKQSIGRVCVLWSVIGLLFHLVLFFFMAQYSTRILVNLLVPFMKASAGGVRGSGMDSPHRSVIQVFNCVECNQSTIRWKHP